MDKNTLLLEYIELLSQKYPRFGIDPSKQRNKIFLDDTTFLRCVAWKIDKINPWRSYILQLVNLPSADGINNNHQILLFDTSNYYLQPRIAGVKGKITKDQLLDAIKFIAKLPDQYIYILGGHHPLEELNIEDWNESDKDLFDKILAHKNTLNFYISSHTHNGYWKEHKIGSQIVKELNIGSINDAPVYYRNLKLGFSDKDGYIVDSRINDLKEIYGNSLCHGVNLPDDSQPHSIKNQDTDNWLMAVYYFFAFWKSKHHEIEPELFVYKDLLLKFVPENYKHKMKYTWDDGSKSFENREELLEEIEILHNCNKNECPERRKARFIIALADFIEKNTHDIQGLRDQMACMSLKAAEEDAGHVYTKKIRKLIMPERISIMSH